MLLTYPGRALEALFLRHADVLGRDAGSATSKRTSSGVDWKVDVQ
jgi:hypothetical protein